MITMDVIDKVIYVKGRVWTIYGANNNGVFCYQGVKQPVLNRIFL